MKTKAISILGLGLVFTFLCLTQQSPAKKPVKPDPPPEPMPVSYTLVDVQIANTSYFNAHSINDYGVLAGSYQYGEENAFQAYNLAPEIVDDSVRYIDANLITLAYEVIDLVVFPNQGRISVNNSGQTSGVRYTSAGKRAVLWLGDVDEIDLGVAPEGIETTSHDINDAGLILVRNADSLTSYVVVPEDVGGYTEWVVDDEGGPDGINDLMYRLTTGLTPVKINEAGQILFREGVLLTPDFEDPDGDDNPWFADDGNGGNGLLFPLSPLVEGAGLTANDMNDLGKIVGTSDDRAVMWEVEIDEEKTITETITELPALSRHSSGLNAMGINNFDQIVGTCWEKKTAAAFLIQGQDMYNLEDLLIDDVDISRSFGRDLLAINNEGWIINIWGDVLVPVVQP